MISNHDSNWPGDSDTHEVRELYELTRALLALRGVFEQAYGRAVFSLLAEGTEEKLDGLFAERRAVVASAKLIGAGASDVLKELFTQRETGEVILAEALANSADRLASLFALLDRARASKSR